jgi:hypothetical protein
MLITLIVMLVVVGVVLYLFNTFVTMDPRFKSAINVLVCLLAFLYIVGALTGHHFGGL